MSRWEQLRIAKPTFFAHWMLAQYGATLCSNKIVCITSNITSSLLGMVSGCRSKYGTSSGKPTTRKMTCLLAGLCSRTQHNASASMSIDHTHGWKHAQTQWCGTQCASTNWWYQRLSSQETGRTQSSSALHRPRPCHYCRCCRCHWCCHWQHHNVPQMDWVCCG